MQLLKEIATRCETGLGKETPIKFAKTNETI